METVSIAYGGQDFSFVTQSALFSPRGLDGGSKLLLESSQISSWAKTILDLGCGWGAMGIILAKLYPDKFVYLVDNDPVAIEFSKKNLELNGVKNAKVIKADVTYSSLPFRFDVVLSNPPWSKNVLVIPYLIRFVFDHLNPGGKFYLAVNRKYRTEISMEKFFGNVRTVKEVPPYKILESRKQGS